MKSIRLSILFAMLLPVLAYGASGTITGTVKDPSGAPFKGAFVRARNEKTKITVSVLSNQQGQYRIQDLAPGDYELRVSAVGFKSDPRVGIKVAAGQPQSFDFSLQKGMVRWSDLSLYQGKMLLPDGKGKDVLFERCIACHGFQSRMAGTRRDEQGWQRSVAFMRDILRYFLEPQFTDAMAADVVSYLNTVFGMDSDLPRSPAELPAYREVARPPFSDEAMKITYVDYELPGPNRFPWSGAPDKDGNIWLPYYGRANRIGKLNPETGAVQEFPVPNQGTASIHSAVPAPDGTVWFSEQGSNKLGKYDPRTQQITEYQAAYKPGQEGTTAGGSKHTVRVDLQGKVWATGGPLSRFDPETKKFTELSEVPSAYGIVIDKAGNAWFAEFISDGKIGRVDVKTGKVTKWAPPTPKARPRRILVADDGMIWFAEYQAGKIGRFDPKTEAFQEYSVPGASPTPYALGMDRDKYIWYSSYDMDVLGRLDTKTGNVTEYPFPYPENGIREFFMDAKGRMWFATGPNNKVGYFVPPTAAETTVAQSEPRP